MDNNKPYEYTYTAPTESERKVAEDIRRRYQPTEKKDTAFMQLKKLDQKARSVPMIVALSLGILGTLLFGGGMAIVLEKLLSHYLLVGISLSVVGLAPILSAYPTYCKLSKKYKDKYGGEIIRLSDEVLNESEE